MTLREKILMNYRITGISPTVIEENNGFFCPYCRDQLFLNHLSIEQCQNEKCQEKIKKENELRKKFSELKEKQMKINHEISECFLDMQNFIIENGYMTYHEVKEKEKALNKELKELESYKNLFEN